MLKENVKCFVLKWIPNGIEIMFEIIQNACGHMEKIVSIDAMFTVSTRPVTDLTAVVCMAVNMDTSVMKVYFFDFNMLLKYILYN